MNKITNYRNEFPGIQVEYIGKDVHAKSIYNLLSCMDYEEMAIFSIKR